MNAVNYPAIEAEIANRLRTFVDMEADDNAEIHSGLQSYSDAIDNLNMSLAALSCTEMKSGEKSEIIEATHSEFISIFDEIRDAQHYLSEMASAYLEDSGLLHALKENCDAFISERSDENRAKLRHCLFLCNFSDEKLPKEIAQKLSECGLRTKRGMTFHAAWMAASIGGFQN